MRCVLCLFLRRFPNTECQKNKHIYSTHGVSTFASSNTQKKMADVIRFSNIPLLLSNRSCCVCVVDNSLLVNV